MTEKYRFNSATGEVYRWSEIEKAYIFIGDLQGRTKIKFIKDFEDFEARQPPND